MPSFIDCMNALEQLCSTVEQMEVGVGMFLVLGLLVRAVAWLAITDLTVRAISCFATILSPSDGVVLGLIVPTGDWVFGMMYVGAITLLIDVLRTGGGRLSLDRAVHVYLSDRAGLPPRG